MEYKKQKTMNKFKSFECNCILDGSKPLVIKNGSKLSCILYNFKLYLQSRNLWNSFFQQYREMIERNIHFPNDDIENVKLVHTDFSETNAFCNYGKIFKLHVTNPNVQGYQKHVDLICCLEFIEFVNNHVHNEDLERDILKAKAVTEKLKMCNF